MDKLQQFVFFTNGIGPFHLSCQTQVSSCLFHVLIVILSTKSAVTSYFISDTDRFCHVFFFLFFVSLARGLNIFLLQDSGSYLNLILLDFSNIVLAREGRNDTASLLPRGDWSPIPRFVWVDTGERYQLLLGVEGISGPHMVSTVLCGGLDTTEES